MPPYWAAILESSMTSSVVLACPASYSSPVESPKAPDFISWATRLLHARDLGRRGGAEEVFAHHLLTQGAVSDHAGDVDGGGMLVELAEEVGERIDRNRRRARRRAVVMPWRTALSAAGSLRISRSAWLCMSMKPGESARPCSSMTVSPLRGVSEGATAAMRSPVMRTSPWVGGLLNPS